MPTQSYEVGPGVLVLNAGTAFEVSAQITNARVEWSENVTTTEAKKTLDGGERAATEKATYRATLAGTAIQDLDAGGFVAWTRDHMGEATTFLLIPSNEDQRGVTGITYPVPLTMGGAVGEDGPTSDFSWRTKGGDANPNYIDVDLDTVGDLVGPNV